MTQPQMWIVAGPNGAGKSTLADTYLRGKLPLINPDNIARELDPKIGHDMSAVSLQAGRLALQRQRNLLDQKSSFAFETTLTGKRELRLMQEAKDKGYKVNLVYVGLHSETLSAFRVATRIKTGGHSIPKSDIKRRYPRSLDNLLPALVLSDRAYILDNSGARRKLLLSVHEGIIKFRTAQKMPDWLVGSVPQVAEGFDETLFIAERFAQEKLKTPQDRERFLSKFKDLHHESVKSQTHDEDLER